MSQLTINHATIARRLKLWNPIKNTRFEKEYTHLRTTSIDVLGIQDLRAQSVGSNIISAGCTGVQRLANWSAVTA
jgi:hypothetical protein